MKRSLYHIIGNLRSYFLAVILLLPMAGFSQLSTTVGSPNNMVQNVLIGAGITVSNIQYFGAASQIGSFTYGGGSPSLGLASGVILSTGNIGDAQGPNNSTSEGVDFNRPGDGTLDGVLGATTYDAVVLEFDFVPQSSSASFRYVFASEEYPEFVGTAFNDIFGFFISGPGITGQQNIALIPNTSTPVAINNVNQNAFNNFFRDNTGGASTEFDGFTAVFNTAPIQVTACETYRIKIAIADVSDGIYDSAVLLEESSFKSASQDIKAEVSFGNPNEVYEGCNQAVIKVEKTLPSDIPDVISIAISGSAQNGTDYTTTNGAPFPTSATFAPNQTSVDLPLIPIYDNQTEGDETITLSITQIVCGQQITKTVTLTLRDNPPIQLSITPADTSIVCPNVPIQIKVNATGGVAPLQYVWNTGQTGSTITVFPPQTTTYTVTVSDACNQQSVTGQAIIRLPGYIPLDVQVPRDTTICPGDSVLLSVQGIGGRGIIKYTWNDGFDSVLVRWVKPDVSTIYTITIVDSCGTTVTKSIAVNVLPTNADFDYYYITNRTIKFVDLSSDDVVKWYWDFGNGDTDTAQNPIYAYGDTGWYKVRLVVENPIGCVDTLIKNIRAYPDYNFYVPNAFTPNGDGVNDNFSGLGQGFITYEMYIFNRWGEVVFNSETYNARWDGRDKSGSIAPQGIYAYVIKLKTPPGDSYTLRGMVALIN